MVSAMIRLVIIDASDAGIYSHFRSIICTYVSANY